MLLSGDQVHSHSASRVKMRDILVFIRIDSHQDSLTRCLSLENALLIGEDNAAEVTVAESFR